MILIIPYSLARISNSQHLYPGNKSWLLLPDYQISLFAVVKYNHVGAMSQRHILFHGLRILLQYQFKHDEASIARFHSMFYVLFENCASDEAGCTLDL